MPNVRHPVASAMVPRPQACSAATGVRIAADKTFARVGLARVCLGGCRSHRLLDELTRRIDWTEVNRLLAGIYVAENGERGWPPLALFRAMLLAVSGTTSRT